jgi:hypothetical protein
MEDEQDWADGISMSDLQALCVELRVSPSFLLREEGEVLAAPNVAAERLLLRLNETGLSVEALSTKIGWELQPILDDPFKLGEYDSTGFRAICGELGLDWMSLLDHMDFRRPSPT